MYSTRTAIVKAERFAKTIEMRNRLPEKNDSIF